MYTDLNADDATGQPCDYPDCDRTDTTPVADHSGPTFGFVPICPEHAGTE